jgi:ABC-type molybdenum transport system ATPase subunit/photorepair protein PhrA
MDLILTNKYKVLQPFEWRDVPSFAVVTGVNGTGKSQLLEIVHASVINSRGITARIQVENEVFKRDEVTYLKGEHKDRGQAYFIDDVFFAFTDPSGH